MTQKPVPDRSLELLCTSFEGLVDYLAANITDMFCNNQHMEAADLAETVSDIVAVAAKARDRTLERRASRTGVGYAKPTPTPPGYTQPAAARREEPDPRDRGDNGAPDPWAALRDMGDAAPAPHIPVEADQERTPEFDFVFPAAPVGNSGATNLMFPSAPDAGGVVRTPFIPSSCTAAAAQLGITAEMFQDPPLPPRAEPN